MKLFSLRADGCSITLSRGFKFETSSNQSFPCLVDHNFTESILVVEKKPSYRVNLDGMLFDGFVLRRKGLAPVVKHHDRLVDENSDDSESVILHMEIFRKDYSATLRVHPVPIRRTILCSHTTDEGKSMILLMHSLDVYHIKHNDVVVLRIKSLGGQLFYSNTEGTWVMLGEDPYITNLPVKPAGGLKGIFSRILSYLRKKKTAA